MAAATEPVDVHNKPARGSARTTQRHRISPERPPGARRKACGIENARSAGELDILRTHCVAEVARLSTLLFTPDGRRLPCSDSIDSAALEPTFPQRLRRNDCNQT